METQKAIDHAIMRRIQQDDFSAFEELVDRYKGRLVNVVNRMLNNVNEAEDLVQETFLRVWTHRQDYDFSYCLSTWIYTIALNLAKNELRNRGRRPTLPLAEETGIDPDDGPQGILLPDRGRGPDEEAALGELRRDLARAMDRLPPKYREVFVLREVEGFSYHEIAKLARLPKGTVKSRINRARIRFKEELEKIRGSEEGVW